MWAGDAFCTIGEARWTPRPAKRLQVVQRSVSRGEVKAADGERTSFVGVQIRGHAPTITCVLLGFFLRCSCGTDCQALSQSNKDRKSISSPKNIDYNIPSMLKKGGKSSS